MKTDNQIIFSDGSVYVDDTDYDRINAMTDEEVLAAAKDDPDAQPLSFEEGQQMRRLWDLPGKTLPEKIRNLANESKKRVSIRCDSDVIAFFRSKGKGYQKLMNTVLREYMNKEMRISG